MPSRPISQPLAFNIRCVIPAQPGFFTLNGARDDTVTEGSLVFRTPIIAWAVEDEGGILPVTPHDYGWGDNHGAILHPDGTVENMFGAWDTVDAWLRDAKRDYKSALDTDGLI